MKKIILSICASMIIINTGNISAQHDNTGKPAKLRILCAILPMYIFSANIIKGANGVELSLLISGQSGCPHDYSLTPGDMSKIASADILIINGLGIESFLPDNLLESYPKLKLIIASEGINGLIKYKAKHSAHHHAGEHDNDIPVYIAEPLEEFDISDTANQGSGVDLFEHFSSRDNEYNPHLWVSPLTAAQEIKNITSGLCSFNPENADIYLANYEKYCLLLESLLAELKNTVKTMPGAKIITVHSTFDYLARDIGLEIADTVFPVSEYDLSPSDIIKITESAKKNNVIAIVTEPQFSPNTANLISQETKAPVIELDPVISGKPSAGEYESAMRKNINALKRIINTNDRQTR